jgi:hypothetical protein
LDQQLQAKCKTLARYANDPTDRTACLRPRDNTMSPRSLSIK